MRVKEVSHELRRFQAFARIGFNDSSRHDPRIPGLLGGLPVSPGDIAGTGSAHLFDGTVSATYAFAPSRPHDAMSSTSVNSGRFLQALNIAHTGREGIEKRAIRFELRWAGEL